MKSRLTRFLVLLVTCLCALEAGALQTLTPAQPTDPGKGIAANGGPGAVIRASIKVPRIEKKPLLEQFLSMDATGPATQMAKVSNFTQQHPTDGAHATQRTDVYLGYDGSTFYAVWVCFDSQPELVRAHMSRRENIYDDDFVELTLDTFHDQRHGLVFAVNPLGIQADGLWTEGGNGPDNSWDTVWDSEGKLTDKGYVVMESIPFRSLRFHSGPGDIWGVTLYRSIARNGEADYWPWVSSRISGRLNQEGTFTGIEGISPGRNLQFIPYASARGFRAIDNRDPLQPRFQSKTFDGKAGLDAKAVIHDSLVFDATLNPDFSQVESDDPQNTVNQRFEVFFPEKRPFFLENANFFETLNFYQSTRLLFTRRIADPEFGARLTGKQGPWNLGFLVADDRSPGKAVPASDPLSGKRAYFAIGRISHDLGENSSVGLIFTDREFVNDFNRVGGLDTNLKLSKNWNFFYRGVVSSTRSRTEGYLYGSNQDASVEGDGRRFTFVSQYQDISPNFRTETGFVRRVDIRRLNNYYHFYFRPEKKHLVFWGPEMSAERIWDHSGTGVEYNWNGDVVFSYRNNVLFAPIIGIESDTLRPVDFPGLPSNRKFIQDFAGLVVKSSPFRQLTYNLNFLMGGAVDVVVPNGQLPTEGDETSITQTLTLKPISQLQIDNTYILDRVLRNNRNAAFNNHIIRTKWNYQYNRQLSFRFIAQYNGVLSNPVYSSLHTTKNMNFDVLLTYLIHPGTALYVGYNSNLENIDPGLCLHVGGTTECDPNGTGLIRTRGRLTNDGRQVFVKVSYLFRK